MFERTKELLNDWIELAQRESAYNCLKVYDQAMAELITAEKIIEENI